ncbi:MAG: crossover junction endodeoxyribonuclease RuvC, partial [bacterium]
MGIDPSLSSTGIGVLEVDRGKWRASFWEVVRPPKEECLSRRLFFLYQRLSEILAVHTPDIVAVEEVFLARDPKAAILLGEAKGAILAAVGAYLREFNIKKRNDQDNQSSPTEFNVNAPAYSDEMVFHQFS